MNTGTTGLVFAALLAAGCGSTGGKASGGGAEGDVWRRDFGLEGRTLLDTGRNGYFILEPGYQLVLADDDDKVQITVLDDTEMVDGVRTRVVEEREWEDGKLVEVSRNFFAICKDSGDVFYFGEDVDMYKHGAVSGHGGAWRAGANGAKAGLAMPGKPVVGMKYQQETAPGIAMDRAEVVGLSATLKTPAGTFANCLKTKEGNALKPGEKEFKIYAPGIGQIQDEELLLVSHGFVGK